MAAFPLCQGRKSNTSAKPLGDCVLCDRRWPIDRTQPWLHPMPQWVDGRCPMRVAYDDVPGEPCAPGVAGQDQSPPTGSSLPALPRAPASARGAFHS